MFQVMSHCVDGTVQAGHATLAGAADYLACYRSQLIAYGIDCDAIVDCDGLPKFDYYIGDDDYTACVEVVG